MSEFNLELTLGQLMEKVSNIEGDVRDIKDNLNEKASKGEVLELEHRINKIETNLKPLFFQEEIRQNDKKRIMFLFMNANTLLRIGALLMVFLGGIGFHASLHHFM